MMMTVLGILNGIWSSPIGKIAAVVLAGLVALKANNYVVAKKAESRVVEKSKSKGREANAKSETARAKALTTPGSVTRLPCRDC